MKLTNLDQALNRTNFKTDKASKKAGQGYGLPLALLNISTRLEWGEKCKTCGINRYQL
jgi:hypothetical protein